MASGSSLLVNDNPIVKDTSVIDEFIKHKLFENNFITNVDLLLRDAYEITIDSRYDYRPDRIAFEQYKQDFYFPAILIANNIGSILQFRADTLDYKCKIPSLSSIQEIIGLPDIQPTDIKDAVDKLFADVNNSKLINN
jgi:hypothetical protein